MVRITYMGKEVQPRKKNGRYASVSRWKVFVGFAVLGAVAGMVALSPENTVSAVNTSQVVTVEVDKTPEKIDNLKWETVDLLQKCESGGRKVEDGIVVLDTNNRGSYGPLQFQRDTVVYYHKKLYGETITGQEAIIFALKEDTARQLAKDVLFQVDGSWKEWYNCSKKLGLADRIALIKEFEK